MKMADRIKQAVKRFQQISLSSLFVILVSVIVMITSVVSLLIFVNLYRNDMEQNAITTSEQAVVQVKNTVFNYTEDMSDIMQMICANIQKEEEEANNFFSNLLKIRSDVVAVTSYDMNGKILKCWTNGQKLKENYIKNLSYVRDLPPGRRNFKYHKTACRIPVCGLLSVGGNDFPEHAGCKREYDPGSGGYQFLQYRRLCG